METHETYFNDQKIIINLRADSTNLKNKVDCGTSFFQAEIENSNIENVQQWANEYFFTRCHCEHDCCGHWFTTSIHAYQQYKDIYLIQVDYAKNY